ncbi:hypothetical protein [Xanthomonas hortorum]|uniref:hypothetical protein n=1 Tax=Xanthomonas hortorum TaxID=56454 RepID=UPI0032E92CDA
MNNLGGFVPLVAVPVAAFVCAQLRHQTWWISGVAAGAIFAALVMVPFLFTTPLAMLLATQAGVLVLGRQPDMLWSVLDSKGRARLRRCLAFSVGSAVLLCGVGLYFTRYPISVDQVRIYLPSELIRVAVGAGCSTAGFAMLLCAFWFALRAVWSVTLGRPLGTIGRA